MEARLLPRLAPSLPIGIPVPIRSGRRWSLARRIAGEPIGADANAALGTDLAYFLRAVHAFPLADARRLGVPEERRAQDVETFRTLVLPLLDGDERRSGDALLTEHEVATFDGALTHADLGPAHVLVSGGRISGVIDWTDARIGDPAVDLGWALYGTKPQFAVALTEAYGVGDKLARRAHLYHALGPWHEVVYGLRGNGRFVASGLEGVRSRLPGVTGGDDTMAR